MTKVVLLPKRARPFFARHPWVFAGSIARVEGPVEPGSEVVVLSHERQFVARGLFNPHSAIRVRLYRWDDADLDEEFWKTKIEAAVSLRRDVLRFETPDSASRLVFSESDGLSGLTVDRYGKWLVAQFTSLALYERRDLIVRLLMEASQTEGVILRVDRTIAEQEGLPREGETIFGDPPPEDLSIVENGLRFHVDLRSGQKTGFYLDQRDNRAAVARYAGGRKVLDLFCYTGGFSLNALRTGGATYSLGFDSSGPAIETARANAVSNGIGSARFETSDVFESLEKLRDRGEKFGLIICDPPKFARNVRSIDDALKGYLRLNRLAVSVLEPGGILATCSCSGLIPRTEFVGLFGQVAEFAGRPIQILESRGPAADHPISVSCPETDYFKCLIARVG